jgi:DNA-binding GntR family transcriptional regulator
MTSPARPAADPPVARQTKQEMVYQTIRDRIMRGVYGPGFRVVIDSIAAELSVSALPVREAIRRLEAEGLLVYRPNVGAQVTPAEPAVFEEDLTVVALLEGYATALAAPTMNKKDLARLRSITDKMVAAMERLDVIAFGGHNHEFHEYFYERCPNASLVQVLREFDRRLDAIRRTVFVHIPYRGALSIAEHRRIIDLIEAGAPSAKIEAAARAHKLATVQSFRDWHQREAER